MNFSFDIVTCIASSFLLLQLVPLSLIRIVLFEMSLEIERNISRAVRTDRQQAEMLLLEIDQSFNLKRIG